MTKSLKCYQCKRVIQENAIEEHIGNKTIKSVHLHEGECHDKFIQRRKDTEDLDYLCKYIRDIYGEGQMEMPSRFCSVLYDIRNGAIRYMKNGVVMAKNLEKEGVSFDILIEAYQLAEKDIKIYTPKKKFVTRLQMYNYGLAIAKNKIPAVIARRKLLEQRMAIRDAQQQKQGHDIQVFDETVVSYKDRVLKPQKDKDDISDLFSE